MLRADPEIREIISTLIFVHMDIDTLISFHKQEAAEELTYITIIFTVILGILGYIGSAKKIRWPIRVAVSSVFAIFLITFLLALKSSLKIHDAIHEEIRQYTIANPDEFEHGKESKLYNILLELGPHQSELVFWMGISLGLLVILGILTYGKGKVFSFKKYELKQMPLPSNDIVPSSPTSDEKK